MGKKKEKVEISKEEEANLFELLKLNRKYGSYIVVIVLLLGFLAYGFYLRFYHIQYPVIGYHNWKTAHYITEARNFAREGFFKYGFFVPMRDSTENIREPLDGQHNDTFPMIGVIVGFLFKIFGESLVIARLANILFSLGSVLVFYFLIKELFEREDIALLCAFLSAINPMYVFFSHNIDVINPGLFFMLLGVLFYIKWIKKQLEENKFSYLYLASLFVMLASITKYTFVVILIPMFFTFPFKKLIFNFKKDPKKTIFSLLVAAIIFSGFPGWMAYSEIYVKNNIFGKEFSQDSLDSYDLVNLVDLSMVGSSDFWNIMKSYVTDNYSMIGVYFAFIGSFLFLMLYFSKNKNKLGYRFMFWYFISVFVFLFIMGYKLSGHSYHQFPVAPLIIFMIGYFMDVIASNIAGFFNEKQSKLLIKIAIFFVFIFLFPLPNSALYAKSIEAKNRQFDTQFPGLDIAGDYIREYAQKEDRMFHSTGQSFGVLWHAGIKGYKPPATAEYLKKAEEENNVNWIFMYQWGINYYFQNQEVMNYIRDNYRLVQFGFFQASQQQVQPIFFLFRKGGTFNETALNSMLQDKALLNRQYSRTDGSFYEIRYINLE